MKIPKKVRVGSRDYEVRLCTREELDVAKKFCGFIEYQEGVIYLIKDQHPQEMFNTLLHEIIHAMNYESHDKMSEDHTERMSRILAMVLRDNPALAGR